MPPARGPRGGRAMPELTFIFGDLAGRLYCGNYVFFRWRWAFLAQERGSMKFFFAGLILSAQGPGGIRHFLLRIFRV